MLHLRIRFQLLHPNGQLPGQGLGIGMVKTLKQQGKKHFFHRVEIQESNLKELNLCYGK
jgi:hypothetical protein